MKKFEFLGAIRATRQRHFKTSSTGDENDSKENNVSLKCMRDPCCPRVIHACITLVYTKFLPISFPIARSRSLKYVRRNRRIQDELGPRHIDHIFYSTNTKRTRVFVIFMNWSKQINRLY